MNKFRKEVEDVLYNNNLIIDNPEQLIEDTLSQVCHYSIHIEVTRNNPYLCLEIYSEIIETVNENYWKNIVKKWNKCFKKNKIQGKAELLIVKHEPNFNKDSSDEEFYE